MTTYATSNWELATMFARTPTRLSTISAGVVIKGPFSSCDQCYRGIPLEHGLPGIVFVSTSGGIVADAVQWPSISDGPILVCNHLTGYVGSRSAIRREFAVCRRRQVIESRHDDRHMCHWTAPSIGHPLRIARGPLSQWQPQRHMLIRCVFQDCCRSNQS